jgi:hypothetical protein
MTVLLDALTWWPWNSENREIRNVTRAPQAPGLVTLGWSTEEDCATVLERPDGSALFHDDAPTSRHRVTLTGVAGQREWIVIRGSGSERMVEVSF